MALRKLKKLQQGGPVQEPAQGGGGPEQLIEMAMQALQSGDPQMAMQVCQMLVEMAGGGAPPAGAPPAPEGEMGGAPPMMKKGGRLSKTKKDKNKDSKVAGNLDKVLEARYGSKFMQSKAGQDLKRNHNMDKKK